MKKIGSKMRSVALILLSVVIVVALALGLTACGSSSEGDKEIAGEYLLSEVNTESIEYEYNGETGYMESTTFITDNVVLYTDGTYMAVKTVITPNDPISDAPMETETAIRYGTYTKGTSTVDVDGTLIKLELSAATRVIWIANVYDGMFIKTADSDNSSDFPTTYIGDDVTQISRSQFMSDYGGACTYYIVLDMNQAEQPYIVSSM